MRPGTGTREQGDRALFDAIGQRYAAKDLVASARLARKLRLERTLSSIPIGPESVILEIGCGAGFAASYLAGRYRKYVGVDHSPVLIEQARRMNGSSCAEFVAASWRDFSTDIRFDVVIMIGVLHHLAEPAGALARCVELLAPGGVIVVNEPHPGNPLVSVARLLRTRIDGDYSDDQQELSRDAIVGLFRDSGLHEIRVRPQGVVSTPFAEVPMRPAWLFMPLAWLACAIDSGLEGCCSRFLFRLSWNLIVTGCRGELAP